MKIDFITAVRFCTIVGVLHIVCCGIVAYICNPHGGADKK